MALTGEPGIRRLECQVHKILPVQGILSVKELLERRVSGTVEIEDYASHLTINPHWISADVLITFGRGGDFIVAGNRVNMIYNEHNRVRAYLHHYAEQKVRAIITPIILNQGYALRKLKFPLGEGRFDSFTFNGP